MTVRTPGEDVDLLCGTASFSDVFFRFLEDGETSSENFCNSSCDGNGYSDDDEDENSFDAKESKAFWNSQDELLQVQTDLDLMN